jgi:ankyrin repeat protein
MQDGVTPAYIASEEGHTEILALLLANKADINAASEVNQFNIFKHLLLIDNELLDFNIAFLYIINDFSLLKHELLFNMLHVSFVCRVVLPQRIRLLKKDTLKFWRFCWQIKRT